jgi:hypothetical protein
MPEPAGNNAAAEAAPSTTPAPADDEDDEDSASSPPGNANAPPQGISLRAAPGQPRQTDLAYQAPPAQQLVFQVQGQVKGFSYSASARLRWQPQGPSYQASQEISAFLLGTRSQASRGQITASGLQPDRFEDRARKAACSQHGLGRRPGTFRARGPAGPHRPRHAGPAQRVPAAGRPAGRRTTALPAGAEITLPTASTKAVEP